MNHWYRDCLSVDIGHLSVNIWRLSVDVTKRLTPLYFDIAHGMCRRAKTSELLSARALIAQDGKSEAEQVSIQCEEGAGVTFTMFSRF